MMVLLLLLAVIGLPLFVVIGSAALLGYRQAEFDPSLAAMEFMRLGESSLLLAVPLFCVAAAMVSRSRWLEGVVPASLVLRTGPGSLGWTMRPDDLRVAGILFAPSLGLVIYSVLVEQLMPRHAVDLQQLFLAGLLPGLLMAFLAILSGPGRVGMESPTGQALSSSHGLRAIAWELPLLFIMAGGLYSGRLSVTEAGFLTVAWLTITLVAVRRVLSLRRLPNLITRALLPAAGILLLIGMVLAWTTLLSDAGYLDAARVSLLPTAAYPGVFLTLLGILFIACGRVLGLFSGLVIGAPLWMVSIGLGVDPLHLGVTGVASLQLGASLAMHGARLVPLSEPHDETGTGWIHGNPRQALFLAAGLLAIIWWPQLALWLPALVS